MSTKATYNISILQHETYARQFRILDGTGTPFDLVSGYTVDAQIRTSATATGSVSFNVTTAPDGYFQLNLTPTQTAALEVGCNQYDVRFVSGSTTLYAFGGKAIVKSVITHD